MRTKTYERGREKVKEFVYYLNIAKSLFLLVIIAFLTGHSVARYVRSLAPLTRSAALHSAPLRYAHSVHGLTHEAHSLVGRL